MQLMRSSSLSLYCFSASLRSFFSTGRCVGSSSISFRSSFDTSSPKELRKLIDRKSTRLNSSHVKISYAVFCLKKKKSDRRHARKGAQRHSVVERVTKIARHTS